MAIADWVKTWPIVNQMLYPLMIVNYVDTSTNGQNQQESFLWYPGAVPGIDRNGWPAFRIALVTGRQDGNGAETIEWVPVIEETLKDDPKHGQLFRVQCAIAISRIGFVADQLSLSIGHDERV